MSTTGPVIWITRPVAVVAAVAMIVRCLLFGRSRLSPPALRR
jgi:hypothetical protein